MVFGNAETDYRKQNTAWTHLSLLWSVNLTLFPRMSLFENIATNSERLCPFPFTFNLFHLMQTSGIALLHLLSLAGVMYIRISQLYWRSLRRVFTVCDCALAQALSHSSAVMYSCKSALHALSLFTDISEDSPTSSFCILEIKPFPWQSFTIIFSTIYRIGIDSDWFCCVLVKSLRCKYLKELAASYAIFDSNFVRWHQMFTVRTVKISYFL